MHHPTDRITHTTSFVTPVVEHWLQREIALWVQPMKNRSDDPSLYERTLVRRSYISLAKEIKDQHLRFDIKIEHNVLVIYSGKILDSITIWNRHLWVSRKIITNSD